MEKAEESDTTHEPRPGGESTVGSTRSKSGGSSSSSSGGGERRRSESETSATAQGNLRPRGESKSQDSVLGSAARSSSGLPHVSPDVLSGPGTPNTISQLLTNLPSSAFTFEGMDYPSPLGSGIVSPLNSSGHKLGHKRPISISPLSSTSQLELNSLIRASPSSLINCITTSRGDSANSIGHLSPSLTTVINPTLFASPHKAPLFSLRNAAHPPPLTVTASFPLSSSSSAGQSPERRGMSRELGGNRLTIKQEMMSEESGGSQSSRNEPSLQFNTNSQESGFNSQPRELETLHEEDDMLSDDEMQTDPSNSDCSSRYTGEGESQDSKHGILDRKPRRVYYSYPSVEEPHNNVCRWTGCDSQCQDLNDLVRHVTADHIYRDSKKEFVCQWANCVRAKKPFKAQYMLLVHMRRHTGEKPHRCTYDGCNKAYSRLENLKTHLRSHTGERPYLCKYEGCGKAFSNASDCAKHMNRTHSSEKPYACLNAGCTKRYTDPSSRRKHMKNCQVNKKARFEQEGDTSSFNEEDEKSQSTAAGRAAGKLKKPDKNKMPPVTKKGLKGESRGVDPGYMSGGSQGQQHSPLKGYGSPPPALQEGGEMGGGGAQWKQEEEIASILRVQTLSDPNDPTSPMAMAFSPHPTGGGGGGGYIQSPHMGPEGAGSAAVVQMDQVTSHMTDSTAANHPNGKAGRQGRGGGLAVPAGRSSGNHQAPPSPAKTFHHHPTHHPHHPHPHPHQQPGGPPQHHHLGGPHHHHHHQQQGGLPPPSYQQPPVYSHSRHSQYSPFLTPPSFPSFPSGYSSLPAELRQPQPPSSVPYTQLPHPHHTHRHHTHHHIRESESTQISHSAAGPPAAPGGNLQTPSSSGYSSGGSPKGGHHHCKSPSDDSSVVGGASIHSNPMTNSYSTFSSNSSRVSSPNGSSNRGDGVHHIPVGGPLQQNLYAVPKTSPRGVVDHTKPYPLQQSLRMPDGSIAHSRLTDDTVSETSGRSWVYSSQSSHYSTFSELSDDVIERLPNDRFRRHNFTKSTPLPLPESMQEHFDAKLNGTGVGITGMECSPPHGNGTGALLGDTFQHPQSPISMQLDFHGDKTMPLYHLPPESANVFTPNDAHFPFFSNSQCTTDAAFEFQMNYDDGGGGANLPNMVFTDMGQSYSNTLPDNAQYLESLTN